jgi:hypothetical protein
MTVGATLAAGALMPALASADTLSCSSSQQQFSQPFSEFGDSNQYVLLSGSNPDSFDPTGWSLSGGATVVSAAVADGTHGQVLDLPAKSQAVSPALCVDPSYPDLRSMTAQLAGTQGVYVQVQFETANGWGSALAMGYDKNTTGTPGFAASRELQIHTSTLTGMVPARFVFTGGSNATGAAQEYQVYRVAVDPRMGH